MQKLARTETSSQQDAASFPYKDANLQIDKRAEDLLSRMTIPEKAGLLF
jgi:hypothetical protein